MRFVPGPDLPTGGTIVGLAGVRDAYATGRGAFKTRAKVQVEPVTARKSGLVVTELPYLVGPERVIEKIKDGVQAKKLAGIANVADFSDQHNLMRLVIEIKTGFDPMAVLEQLYRYTPLEESFSINNVALVNGGPRTLGLLELMQVYIDHRIDVVTRRTRYRLARREERLHLVEGLLIAILDIDRVIAIIRGSDDTDQARTGLMEAFRLSQAQADYILELRLRRLTRFSTIELESEAQQLRDEIEQLRAAAGGPRAPPLDRLRRARPGGRAVRHAAPHPARRRRRSRRRSRRRTRPTCRSRTCACRVLLSTSGRAVRVDLPEGGTIERPRRRSRHDAIVSEVDGTSRGELGAVTNRGRLVRFTPGRSARRPGRLRAARRRHPDRRLPRPRREGARARAGRARGRPDRARHRDRRRQARDDGPVAEQAGLRDHRAEARRRGRRRRARARRREPRLPRLRRAAAALPGGRRPPAGRGRRRHGRHLAERRREGDRLRRRGRRDRGRRDRVRGRRHDRGARGGPRQGHGAASTSRRRAARPAACGRRRSAAARPGCASPGSARRPCYAAGQDGAGPRRSPTTRSAATPPGCRSRAASTRSAPRPAEPICFLAHDRAPTRRACEFRVSEAWVFASREPGGRICSREAHPSASHPPSLHPGMPSA